MQVMILSREHGIFYKTRDNVAGYAVTIYHEARRIS